MEKDKKSIPSWVFTVAVALVVIVVVAVGYRAVNPPLPPIKVGNMTHGYAPAPPPNYSGAYAKNQ